MSRLTAVPTAAARWSARHPRRAILGWLAFVAIAIATAIVVPVNTTTDADYRIGESGRADAMIAEAGLDRGDAEQVLITARDGRQLDRRAAEGAVIDLTRAMTSVAGVAGVAPTVWSPDGEAGLVSIALDEGAEDAAPLLTVTSAVAANHPGLLIEQAGDLTIDADINDRVADDLRQAEVISVPMTLLLMLLAFGALIAAGVPVLLAGTSVAATLGIAAPLSYLVPAEPTVNSMIVLIGMAVGVDYSLFYLKREREERARGAGTVDAVTIAAQTSGHAILVSGAAVIAAMAGLYLVGAATFDSLATGAITVVAVAVAGSLTVLPAVLAALGNRVDRPRIPLLWRLNRRIGPGGISTRILTPVLRRPGISLVAALAVTIVLSIPALGMTLHSANLRTLPGDIPSVATALRVVQHFPSEGTTATVVVRADGTGPEQVRPALERVSDSALNSPHFVDPGADAITLSSDGRVGRLDLVMPYEFRDPAVTDAIEQLRGDLVPDALGAGMTHAVGGDAADSLDFAGAQSGKLVLVIGFVLALTLLMILVAFRSLWLALVSTALNLLSVGVAFGLMTWVFQDGHLEGWLDFTSPGFLIDWIPLFVLTVLLGLSMDYHVFVLSRVREHIDAGLPAREAVRRGIGASAGVVTSAAAVMISVFALFATLSMMEMKMMGVALSVAILIDATVIRLVILPAALVLLGDRAWPGRRRRAEPALRSQASERELQPA